MDKREAIEFLKQYLSDIPRLAKLDLDNEEYPLWYSKIRDIIEAVFGRDSSEYQDFVRCDWQAPMRRMRILEGLHRNDYISNLKRIKVALKGIIQKYEILEIEIEPAAVAKQPLGKEIRRQLSGTPEEIAPHIVRVAQEFQFQGFKYLAQEVSYKSSRFSKKFTILCGKYVGPQIWFIGGDEDDEGIIPQVYPKEEKAKSLHDIGTIILQSLPENKTLMISKPKLSNFDSEGSYFDSFLERLSLEFKNLGIEETTVQKTWRWFNRIIELWNKLKP
jgi:hypothetical protein